MKRGRAIDKTPPIAKAARQEPARLNLRGGGGGRSAMSRSTGRSRDDRTAHNVRERERARGVAEALSELRSMLHLAGVPVAGPGKADVLQAAVSTMEVLLERRAVLEDARIHASVVDAGSASSASVCSDTVSEGSAPSTRGSTTPLPATLSPTPLDAESGGAATCCATVGGGTASPAVGELALLGTGAVPARWAPRPSFLMDLDGALFDCNAIFCRLVGCGFDQVFEHSVDLPAELALPTPEAAPSGGERSAADPDTPFTTTAEFNGVEVTFTGVLARHPDTGHPLHFYCVVGPVEALAEPGLAVGVVTP